MGALVSEFVNDVSQRAVAYGLPPHPLITLRHGQYLRRFADLLGISTRSIRQHAKDGILVRAGMLAVAKVASRSSLSGLFHQLGTRPQRICSNTRLLSRWITASIVVVGQIL